MGQPPLTVKRWKRAEYERLVGLGVFAGDPVELIGGHLIVAEPQSAPEPDLAVVSGRRADYGQGHPTRAVLVVEVADSSLHFDRREKGSLYARARIAEYWIVNLIDRVVEVYRDPEPDPTAPHGSAYRSVSRLAPPAVVAPVALPSAQVRVGDLLG